MATGVFDEYDHLKLKKAKNIILKVYEYNYGDPKMKKELNRLNTILRKLDVLIEDNN